MADQPWTTAACVNKVTCHGTWSTDSNLGLAASLGIDADLLQLVQQTQSKFHMTFFAASIFWAFTWFAAGTLWLTTLGACPLSDAHKWSVPVAFLASCALSLGSVISFGVIWGNVDLGQQGITGTRKILLILEILTCAITWTISAVMGVVVWPELKYKYEQRRADRRVQFSGTIGHSYESYTRGGAVSSTAPVASSTAHARRREIRFDDEISVLGI